jgi:hypothetical protein
VTGLPEKIVAVHEALQRAALPHAFGGARALAWCTGRARGTIDIDINVFVDADAAASVIGRLPPSVRRTRKDVEEARREGQVRLWWDNTPVDLFLNTTDFHRQAAERTRWERFMGHDVPFLSCNDLAAFKAYFNRTKDWADLEEMQAAGTLDVARVSASLIPYLGTDDPRIAKLAELTPARWPP